MHTVFFAYKNSTCYIFMSKNILMKNIFVGNFVFKTIYEYIFWSPQSHSPSAPGSC